MGTTGHIPLTVWGNLINKITENVGTKQEIQYYDTMVPNFQQIIDVSLSTNPICCKMYQLPEKNTGRNLQMVFRVILMRKVKVIML